jgi:hypothetical protein
MRQITPVFWGNRKPAYPCSIPLKSRTDLPLKYPNGNQQPCFLASFAINSLLFPTYHEIRRRRPVWGDGVHHQEVRANRRDFLRHRIARHSRGLRRRQSVCWVVSTVSAAQWRPVRSKVSGRKFPFPRLLFATCPSRPISNGPYGFEPRHLTRFRWMDQPLAER